MASDAVGVVVDLLEERLGPGGSGLAVVTGDGLSDLTDVQLRLFLLTAATQLGRLSAQNSDGEIIVSVRDERPVDVATARGYQSNGPMLMHTDPTDIAGLLCLRPGSAGGANSFASAAAVLDVITEEAPELVSEYFRLWNWDLRGTQRPGAPHLIQTPIFSLYRGHLSCRYGSLMLREGMRLAAGGLNDRQSSALDLFEDVAQRAAVTFDHTLQRGESVWIDNYRVLHSRTSFTDNPTQDKSRHLLRTWIWRQEHRSCLAPSFRAFAEAIDWIPQVGIRQGG
ncbi:TauD/TfdA family dioxygenase [Nocardia amamiensis]|uniref:TauD/TfdA family dioxygenase n=1 Tax=Nocardia amamiensis TaxID=404578 RepID=A0ABS0CRA2_9NOCA|nr:TauD/TfdA family dioxygenase [Nocardia amamiensis]MBF6299070.1 TauD/TfdA family dioxygenase [Nocardia amamiensis]